jgi:septum formation protein
VSFRHPFLPELDRPLVLASRSPRRADILRAHGLEFTILPADVEEITLPNETPEAAATRLAREKTGSVAATRPEAACLGSDTIVVLGDEILGKPADPAEAESMLARLAGHTHTVVSAVAMQCRELGHDQAGWQSTRVRFRDLSSAEIRRYVATGEPLDKAGAYGIQGWGALLVEGIEGCYFNVMGLPLQTLRELWLAFHARVGEQAKG